MERLGGWPKVTKLTPGSARRRTEPVQLQCQWEVESDPQVTAGKLCEPGHCLVTTAGGAVTSPSTVRDTVVLWGLWQ